MTNDNDIITYRIPHDPQEYLNTYANTKARMGHRPKDQCSITDTVDPNSYKYIRNFRVYARIKHREFVPKGTKLYNMWTDVRFTTNRDQYMYNEYHTDITSLFVAHFNNDCTEIIIEPRNHNAYTWIKNNYLLVEISCVCHDPTRKQRHQQKQSQQHQRFYSKILK